MAAADPVLLFLGPVGDAAGKGAGRVTCTVATRLAREAAVNGAICVAAESDGGRQALSGAMRLAQRPERNLEKWKKDAAASWLAGEASK